MTKLQKIIEATKETSSYFFSKDTLRFFNQRLSDFKVKEFLGDTYIIAPSVQPFGTMWTIRKVIGDTLEIVNDYSIKQELISMYFQRSNK